VVCCILLLKREGRVVPLYTRLSIQQCFSTVVSTHTEHHIGFFSRVKDTESFLSVAMILRNYYVTRGAFASNLLYIWLLFVTIQTTTQLVTLPIRSNPEAKFHVVYISGIPPEGKLQIVSIRTFERVGLLTNHRIKDPKRFRWSHQQTARSLIVFFLKPILRRVNQRPKHRKCY